MTAASDDEPGGEIRIPAEVYARVAGDPLAVAALVELVRRAAWRPCSRFVAGREVTLDAGDLVTSREAFAAETGLTPAQARRAWERLEKAGLIAVHASARGCDRGTRVTVLHLTAGLQNSQRLTHDRPAVEPETGPRQTHEPAYERVRVTMQSDTGNRSNTGASDPRIDPQKTHDGPNERPKIDPRLAHNIASNVGDLSRFSDLGSEISGSPDLGSGSLLSSEPPILRSTRNRVQVGDPRAAEQARLLRVIGAEHRAAHARMRQELGFDIPGDKSYIPAMQALGDPAERALRELLAAQVTLDGFEERARHVLAVAEHEARHVDPPSLRWFGASLWSPGSFGRAVAMSVGEDRRPPARGAPVVRESLTAKSLRRVAELEALEREEEQRAVDASAL